MHEGKAGFEIAAGGEEYASLLELPMTETERTAIMALVKHGSQNRAAEALGWKRTRVQSRLRSVQARARAAAAVSGSTAPKVDGHVGVAPANVPAHLAGATTARYLLTAAQNNTHVHADFLTNLEAYAAFIGARIMVARFSYNKAAYGANSTKAGRGPTGADTAGMWYDPAIAAYVCDDPERHGSCRWQLAPGESGLLWCAEMNILPTAVHPLSGLDAYSGSASGVFPHAKIALESVPVIGDREPKFLYTTGAITQRNYIAKKEGLKAEFHHQFGALLVEVDLATGDWWARQINADDSGAFMDLTRRVADGEVTTGHSLLAIAWGDVHASEIDPKVRAVNWGKPGCVIDVLRPKYQIWHDTFSMRSRSHHEQKSFAARAEKFFMGPDADTVESELEDTATLMGIAHRDWCEMVVVSSNHDRHLERWLDEADYKADLPNAEFFLEMQLARVRALRVGGGGEWNALEWALVQRPTQCPAPGALGARFLGRDESFRIGPPGHEIECGAHGDEGPDGARGNTSNLSRLSVRIVKGHDHKATIRHGVFSSGVCNRRLAYAHGPSSWSISHTAVYTNGKRCILTQRAGKLWL